MADREKVINGLECVICPNRFCGDCSYSIRNENDPDTGWCNRDAIYKDALSLLKAQEPRVMTLKEVKTAEVVWIEQVGVCIPAIKIRVVEDGKIMFAYSYEENIHTINIMPKYYGKISRCWTSRPTEEQREAVKWE